MSEQAVMAPGLQGDLAARFRQLNADINAGLIRIAKPF
jgi:hypothetical protein